MTFAPKSLRLNVQLKNRPMSINLKLSETYQVVDSTVSSGSLEIINHAYVCLSKPGSCMSLHNNVRAVNSYPSVPSCLPFTFHMFYMFYCK